MEESQDSAHDCRVILQSPLSLPEWDFLAGVDQALECIVNVDIDGRVVHRSPAVIQNCKIVAGADGLLQRFQGWEVLSWRARPSAGAIDLSLCPPPEPQPRSWQQDAAPREDARSAHSFLSGGRYPAESSAHRSQAAQPGPASRPAAPETQDLSLLGTLPADQLSPAAAQLLLLCLGQQQRPPSLLARGSSPAETGELQALDPGASCSSRTAASGALPPSEGTGTSQSAAVPVAPAPVSIAGAPAADGVAPDDGEPAQDPGLLREMLKALQREQDRIQAQLTASSQQSNAGARDGQAGDASGRAGTGALSEPRALQPPVAAALEARAPSSFAHQALPVPSPAASTTGSADDAADEVVARTPTRPMNRYLTSVEARVLFSEEQAAALSAPPCGLALTMQLFLDGVPLGPPQGAQLCRYNSTSPRYLTSIPSQEATSPPLPWKRLAETFLHYRRMRSGVLQMHASTRPPGQGDDTTLQLAPAVAAALPPLTPVLPPALKRLTGSGQAAAAAGSARESGSGLGVCEDGPAEEAWAEATSRQGRAAPPSAPAEAASSDVAAVEAAGPTCSEVQVCCPPRSLSRYLTKSELEVLVGPEVYGCMCDGSKLSGVKVQFEVNGKKMPEVYVADIERYNPSSPFYLKASSGRGVDGLPWRSIPPNATVQWKRMADNTLVLAQVMGSAQSDSMDCGDTAPGAMGRKRRAACTAPSDDSDTETETVTETETEEDPSEDGSVMADEEAAGSYDIRWGSTCKRTRVTGASRSRLFPEAPRSPPTGTHLLDALAGAAAAAALDLGLDFEPKSSEVPTPPASTLLSPGSEAPRAASAGVGMLVPNSARAGAKRRSSSNDDAAKAASAGGPSGPSSSGFTSRIVATNLYIGRRQLQALYGPDFAAEAKSEMQLHLNGSLQPEVFTVQWKEGCHKGSFYPRGAPLGQLRGRFLQDIRWLDEQANRLAFVAWDTPPADWAGQRSAAIGIVAPAVSAVTKNRKWLWQRQAELASVHGVSAAASSAVTPLPPTAAAPSGLGGPTAGQASEAQGSAAPSPVRSLKPPPQPLRTSPSGDAPAPPPPSPTQPTPPQQRQQAPLLEPLFGSSLFASREQALRAGPAQSSAAAPLVAAPSQPPASQLAAALSSAAVDLPMPSSSAASAAAEAQPRSPRALAKPPSTTTTEPPPAGSPGPIRADPASDPVPDNAPHLQAALLQLQRAFHAHHLLPPAAHFFPAFLPLPFPPFFPLLPPLPVLPTAPALGPALSGVSVNYPLIEQIKAAQALPAASAASPPPPPPPRDRPQPLLDEAVGGKRHRDGGEEERAADPKRNRGDAPAVPAGEEDAGLTASQLLATLLALHSGTTAPVLKPPSEPRQISAPAPPLPVASSAASAPPAPGAVDTSRVCVGGDFEPTEHLLIRAMPWLSVHLAQRWYPAALGRTSEDPFPVTVAFEIDGWLLPDRFYAHLKSYSTNNGLFLPGLPLRRVRGLARTGWRRLPDGTLVLQARTPEA
ncbi:hypothetical protein HYH03_015798 [Edaphochlamys debaryana]|uniref:Uncharacterized protein n=1 Tax=Edaphochlamys debaryana TaxID=47281 RepID=A0A835XL43_9CHLO|nr:hypothetical protein HYH03_015798 [Edaphochlamys debaryana]|eukprot:KAG2485415.1 hypothetical protein HYH03_015798 [Edaphochlamys debaryana]